jgi:hypothetical protein
MKDIYLNGTKYKVYNIIIEGNDITIEYNRDNELMELFNKFQNETERKLKYNNKEYNIIQSNLGTGTNLWELTYG